MIRGFIILWFILSCKISSAQDIVTHATPAQYPPSFLIQKVIGESFGRDPVVLLYAEKNDTDAYGIAVMADGKIHGFHRAFATETDGRITEYPVEALRVFEVPTVVVAQLQKVMIGALKEVKFADNVAQSTGSPARYIIGVDRYIGEIRDGYHGSSKLALDVCTLIVKIMKDEGGARASDFEALRKFLNDQ